MQVHMHQWHAHLVGCSQALPPGQVLSCLSNFLRKGLRKQACWADRPGLTTKNGVLTRIYKLWFQVLMKVLLGVGQIIHHMFPIYICIHLCDPTHISHIYLYAHSTCPLWDWWCRSLYTICKVWVKGQKNKTYTRMSSNQLYRFLFWRTSGLLICHVSGKQP